MQISLVGAAGEENLASFGVCTGGERLDALLEGGWIKEAEVRSS
ncbi:hypothetical protein [Pseudomonas idahonensis]|nr:hypothetical protein [Pseudomonas idahonensis]